MDERRHWAVRLHDSAGGEHWLHIAVPFAAGNVVCHIEGLRLVISPEVLARILRIAAAAQSLAVQDRARWAAV